MTDDFAYDVILPSQWARRAISPEHRLMVAVLEQTLDDLRRKPYRADAERYLLAESRALYSFRTICEHLGLDPVYVRNGMLSLIPPPGRRMLTRRPAA